MHESYYIHVLLLGSEESALKFTPKWRYSHRIINQIFQFLILVYGILIIIRSRKKIIRIYKRLVSLI